MPTEQAPPIIDFSPFYEEDQSARRGLINQVRSACESFGFFQIVNHGVPESLRQDILKQSVDFFKLSLEIKEKYNKDIGGFNRGYERLRAQNFEKKTEGDLKEGYYFGTDLPLDHPYVVGRKINLGPNKYPEDVSDPTAFKVIVDSYFKSVEKLAHDILRILASTLNLDEDFFQDYVDTPIAILRLLHYPPQPANASSDERGIGAHTDFGGITILLQDMIGGLQVWNKDHSTWVDVKPLEGAFVVNLGNMMMRWTNDHYLSNLHRVINKTGKERYSVPFFFSAAAQSTPPISVEEWITGRYADTYGTKDNTKAMKDLSVEAEKAYA
ncbi:Oxoglutarate/iron-dependent dioxygenase [Penicillium manginii]|uniref:Oxoglutarate/iron-dependent dioxygenase n=1 Tax=Penicillium manginii TaxID=203109 RepID=UPI0025467F20|nr:Oxoglutarate/iron-dependent dioxygenase [Penicillium manginii]KAJ5742320.1 Oxoglutarate/iron-dependent dioxygenase [Penicillium manginii]